jgi:hypothetical protein
MEGVYDLTGRKFTGGMRVTLRPGFAIRYGGEHVEGGPHVLPVAIALDLIHTNRADALIENAQAPAAEEVQAVVNADPVADHRDPVVDTQRPGTRATRRR